MISNQNYVWEVKTKLQSYQEKKAIKGKFLFIALNYVALRYSTSRHVHCNVISTSLEAFCNYCAKTTRSLISTTVYIQVDSVVWQSRNATDSNQNCEVVSSTTTELPQPVLWLRRRSRGAWHRFDVERRVIPRTQVAIASLQCAIICDLNSLTATNQMGVN